LIEDPDTFFEVPTQWQGEYFPAYIPHGFTLSSVDESKLVPEVEYRNQNNEKLVFTEYSEGAGVIFDTENAVTKDITINGLMGQCTTKDDTVRIYWQQHNKFLHIYYIGEESEAIRIAQSIQKVIKK